ncbi:MAG: hypothetical protein QF371_09080 [Flavobacteriales bacterium]|jgi:hypothetical protein|nr:hypothetical protein [Flavobacteriales bacterium]
MGIFQTVFHSPADQPQFTIDLSAWPANGLYFLYLMDDERNTIEVKKIVIE